jgi:hypothetical protein
MDDPFLELSGTFRPEDFDRWKQRRESGNLYEEWAAEYPALFGEDDLALVGSDEAKYHFFEWWGAIHLYTVSGYHSLVEQYAFAKYPRKSEMFRKVLHEFPEVCDFMKRHIPDEFGWTQAPDLLVFKRDTSDWFFCDVKSPTDFMRPKQRGYFAELARRTGRQVRILKLIAVPKASTAASVS